MGRGFNYRFHSNRTFPDRSEQAGAAAAQRCSNLMIRKRFSQSDEMDQSTCWRSNAKDALQLCVALVLLLLMLSVAACSTTERTRTPDTPPDTPPVEEPPRGPVTRTVDGFRIQIGMFNEQSAAEEQVEAASAWYRNLPSAQRPPYLGQGDLDVHIAWRAPYYRVQVGRFASRAEADRALGAVADRFPDAFPVPATVTVTR